MTAALLTEEDLVIELAGRMGPRGTQGRAAQALGVHQGELSGVLNGHRKVRAGLAAALGYRKVIRFEPVS